MGERAPLDALGALPPGVAQQIIDTAINPFCLLSEDAIITWVSPAISELVGFDPAELIGRSALDLVAPEDQNRVASAFTMAEQRVRDGLPGTWEGAAPTIHLLTADGDTRRVQIAVATAARTGIDGYVVQIRRASGESWLREAMVAMAAGAELRRVIAHLVQMAHVDLPWVRVSAAWGWDGERFAQAESELDGVDLTRSWGPAAPWHDIANEIDLDARGTRTQVDDLPAGMAEAARAAGAEDVWFRVVGGPAEGRALVIGWHVARWAMTVFTAANIDRVAHLVGFALRWDADHQALSIAASHDHLTGLLNRRSFLDALAADRPQVTVLYLDLDDFKPVNDQHGHALGDAVLAAVAARLRGAVRPTDVVARLGGDEFAVLCPELDDQAASQLAARLVASVSQPIELAGTTVCVGLSVGIAATVDRDDDREDVLRRADVALRQAKAAGKGLWRHG